MASFTEEVNSRLDKRPLKINGRLANRGLTSLVKEDTGVPSFYQYRLTLIPACTSNYMHHKIWDYNSFPLPNFNSCTVEVWEWTSSFIPHFIMDVFTYPCLVTMWCLCAFFPILPQLDVPFYVKKPKLENFMCLWGFEYIKKLKVHSQAIPDISRGGPWTYWDKMTFWRPYL